MLKFNLFLWGFFSALFFFGAEALRVDFPYAAREACPSMVWLMVPMLFSTLPRKSPPSLVIISPVAIGAFLAFAHSPLSYGIAAAASAAMVWGHDIIAGVPVRIKDREWREEEISAQKIALAAERRHQEEESASLLRSYSSNRRAA